MATLTVWKFTTAEGAEAAAQTLQRLTTQELIRVHDAAIVTWPEGKKKPRTRQLNNLVGASGMLTDTGIDDGFINRVRDEVTPGTSALFVLTSGAVLDRVQEAFAGQDMHLVHTNLSRDQEEKLLSAFAEDPAAALSADDRS
jgi:uncharacterized membrane protein